MRTKENVTLGQFKDGLLTQNPTLVLLLGMCPTLAVSTSIENGVGMGLCATLVLICSNAIIAALRKIIPDKIRIAVYVVVIAGFVTMVDLAMAAFLPSLSKSLGLFIPLIVVNCIILARAEAYASKNTVARSAIDGLTMGLGFTLALTCMSFVRELLGNGTLLGHEIVPGYMPAQMLAMPAGGFLTLGCLIALTQTLLKRRKKGVKR